MPTMPRLIAALWYALLAWFVAEMSKTHMPEGTQFGRMSLYAGAIGLGVGWVFAGRRAGDSMRAAYGYGFTSGVLIAFWGVGFFAVVEMLRRAWDGRFRGPMHALAGMVDLAREYALIVLLNPDMLIVLLGGGVFGGWLVEKSARKWS
ncbi:TrgA family protein [Celeribacter sp.]|uniref:TrgA family protein n=1 Tax=Celeribacter sp. TaxID=1890673 RepID=UPI003A90669B